MEKRGLAIFEGIACGKVLIYEPYKPEGAACAADRSETVQERLDAYSQAVETARTELDTLYDAVVKYAPEKAKILQAHQLLVEDVAIEQEIQEQVLNGKPLSQAVNDVFDLFIGMFEQAGNAFTQERTADLKDVRNRIMRCLEKKPEKNLSHLLEPCVIFARELLPSDTAAIDRKNVLAIATELGGATSHTAIIARSYGIPTVLGVDGILACACDGDEAIVDGTAGLVVLRPSACEIEGYRQKQLAEERHRELVRACRGIPAVTKDGTTVAIKLNISSVEGLCAEDIAASDGVGLMRSEFLYMQSQDGPPDENSQFQAYKAAVLAFRGKPVVLRTLDIGGDKQLPYMALPREDNPFLGKRALRLSLEETGLFRTQLRAALRASQLGDLWLMFPMVASLEDFRAAKAFVHTVMAELDAEKIPYNKNIPLGIMIEVPSIALIADQTAQEVDFASIGTNDLCQYLMAADRLNPSVAAYYQSYHPAVFRLIDCVAKQFSKRGKPLSVCGEMGSSPAVAIALVGLGVGALSMDASGMAAVKQAITGVTTKEAQRIAEDVCARGTADEVERLLAAAAEDVASRRYS
jgi:phosphotransferase system enzyme I (PtsI)